MTNKSVLITISFLLSFTAINKAYAHKTENLHHDSSVLKVYTEESFPPFNYLEDGNINGYAVEIVDKILANAKFQHTKPKVLPWARAYYLTKKQPNSMLFSVYRTPERENEFDWVGPIYSSKLVIFAKKGNNLDTENYNVASVRESAGMQTVQKHIDTKKHKIEKVNNNKLCIKLLNLERVDGCALSIVGAHEVFRKLGLNKDDFYVYKELEESSLYIGFNKNTPQHIKNFFAEKLIELKKTGFLDKLTKKHIL